jgi:nucleotide-binding universal stress UspA family protein
MKSILIATDFSDPAKNAVTYGAELAKYLNADLVLVNAYSLPIAGYDSIAPLNVVGEMESSSREALEEVRTQLQAKMEKNVTVDCIAEAGTVLGVLSSAISRTRSDLVVMGMVGGAGGIKKHVLGSSVLDVVRDITVPCIIVPEQYSFKKIEKISYAYDNQGDILANLVSAKYFAKLFSAELELVHVTAKNDKGPVPMSESDMDNVLHGTEHSYQMLYGENIALSLQQHYEKHPADLVMLCPHKHGIFRTLFASSLTEKLVYKLKVPVLAFHREQ